MPSGHRDTMHQCRVRYHTNQMMRHGRRAPSRVYASCECPANAIFLIIHIYKYLYLMLFITLTASVNFSLTHRMATIHSRNVPWPHYRRWRSRPHPAAAASRSKCLYSHLRAKCIPNYSIIIPFFFLNCENDGLIMFHMLLFSVFFVLFYLFLVPVCPLLCFICSLSIYRFLLQCT